MLQCTQNNRSARQANLFLPTSYRIGGAEIHIPETELTLSKLEMAAYLVNITV